MKNIIHQILCLCTQNKERHQAQTLHFNKNVLRLINNVMPEQPSQCGKSSVCVDNSRVTWFCCFFHATAHLNDCMKCRRSLWNKHISTADLELKKSTFGGQWGGKMVLHSRLPCGRAKIERFLHSVAVFCAFCCHFTHYKLLGLKWI